MYPNLKLRYTWLTFVHKYFQIRDLRITGKFKALSNKNATVADKGQKAGFSIEIDRMPTNRIQYRLAVAFHYQHIDHAQAYSKP